MGPQKVQVYISPGHGQDQRQLSKLGYMLQDPGEFEAMEAMYQCISAPGQGMKEGGLPILIFQGEQVNIYFHLSQAVLDSFTGQGITPLAAMKGGY